MIRIFNLVYLYANVICELDKMNKNLGKEYVVGSFLGEIINITINDIS